MDDTGTIKTFTGRHINLLNPDPRQISQVDIAKGLSQQGRYNGQLASIFTVAQHSVYVAERLAMMGLGPKIVFMGLMHDAAEAYIGDLVRPMKYIPEMHEVYVAFEERMDAAIAAAFPGLIQNPMPGVIKEADREEAQWEREFIRGRFPSVRGWQPEHAEYVWLEKFDHWAERAA
jgi:5'-deoxynucleotidase YfbR-like HD superfamily hydrolase